MTHLTRPIWFLFPTYWIYLYSDAVKEQCLKFLSLKSFVITKERWKMWLQNPSDQGYKISSSAMPCKTCCYKNFTFMKFACLNTKILPLNCSLEYLEHYWRFARSSLKSRSLWDKSAPQCLNQNKESEKINVLAKTCLTRWFFQVLLNQNRNIMLKEGLIFTGKLHQDVNNHGG